ncbi:MAG: exodeoxyribonuclease III [bacterium]
MRIATWNVNGLRARFEFFTHWLRAREPDVVCLQELKLEDEQFPHEELSKLGYRAVTHGQKAWNGVAVVSRHPLEPVTTGLAGQEAAGARLVTARVGKLAVTSVYVPNGKTIAHEDYPGKLAWLDALAAHWREHADPSGPAILAGDFNVCPAPIDSWNEEKFAGSIFHTAEERERIAALRDLGLRDAYRSLHPEDPGFSWWDYRMGAFHRGFGLRIDLVFTSAAVDLREARVDRDYRKKKEGLTASDHAPVIVEIDDVG